MDNKGEMAQMVEQMLINFFQTVLSSNPGQEGFFFNREKQLFMMNPRQDSKYHAETGLSILL